MGYKTSEDQRNALVLRAEEIGLDATIAHECRSEEQQDIMLQLQKQIGTDKVVYLGLQDKAPDKPGRDYELLMKKLNDLINHTAKSGDKDTYDLLEKVQLQKKNSEANEYRNDIKNRASKSMTSDTFTNTRRESVLAEFMKCFDSYEPTEADHKFFTDFTL